MKPRLIIMDESTSMLDPKGKKEITELILKLKKEDPSLTILSITHDIEEAYHSSRVIVLNKGKSYIMIVQRMSLNTKMNY